MPMGAAAGDGGGGGAAVLAMPALADGHAAATLPSAVDSEAAHEATPGGAETKLRRNRSRMVQDSGFERARKEARVILARPCLASYPAPA